jgi:hypothetical protein
LKYFAIYGIIERDCEKGCFVVIGTTAKLRVHLNHFKNKLKESGVSKFNLYPAFCEYFRENRHKYNLPLETILNTACEILVEED